jgi:hypothetical protein
VFQTFLRDTLGDEVDEAGSLLWCH